MSRKSRFRKSEPVVKASVSWEKVGIYTRVSVSDGGSVSESIKNQENYIKKYISEREDFVYVKTYVDDGHFGLNFNRPAFQEMLQDIEYKKINCVIVKDLSRLGRNYREVGIYLLQIFPYMGVRMISINDNYDNQNREEELWNMSTITNTVMNYQVSADISQRVSNAIDTKMKEGTYLPPSGSIPYGYLRDAKNNTFSIDLETWLNIRLIYKLREEGRSYTEIARIMNETSVPSPGKLKYLRGQIKKRGYETAVWTRGVIKDILHDQAYIGRRVHGKVKKDGLYAQKHTTQPDDWTIIENAHPVIVPKELFDRVQEINRQESARMASRGQQAAAVEDHRALFRGKLFCGDCGKIMRAEKRGAKADSGKESVIYYDCSGYVDSGRVRCSAHYVCDDALTGIVTSAILDNESVLWGEDYRRELAHQDFLKSELLERLAKIQKEEEYLTQELGKRNSVPDNTRDSYNSFLRQHRDGVRGNIDQYLANLSTVESNLRVLSKVYELVKDFRSAEDLTREIMDTLIYKIEVYESKTVQVTFTLDIPCYEKSYA